MPIINSGSGFYIGRLFDIQLSAELRHRGLLVYKRDFKGNNAGIVSITDNKIILPDHFFVTGEKINYRYDGDFSSTANAIGITTTNFEKYGFVDYLPRELYAIKINDSELAVAASKEDALRRNPVRIDFTNVGAGLSHYFVGETPNTRALLTIDNVIQSPVIETIVDTRLIQDLAGAQDIARFAGITSFFVGDLIKINDEIMTINYVGLGDPNTVLLRRPVLGSFLQNHRAGDRVVKLSGNYNIVESTVYFPVAPFGIRPVSDPNNPDPEERDYTGIETFSTFDGRVFLRSGVVDTEIGPYDTNYLFDDISPSFLGISTQAEITSGNQSISGVATNQGVVLINNVLQTPDFIDFGFGEGSGITTITFTGTQLTNIADINTSTIPRGGIIEQIGTNEAFGYQPRVSAGGTSIIQNDGTIIASIGNSGSGYRGADEYIFKTRISSPIPYGTANIFIDDVDGLYEKLNLLFVDKGFDSNVSIVIQDVVQDRDIDTGDIESNIVSIGNTFVTLISPSANQWKTASGDINVGAIVYIRVREVPVGIANVYVKSSTDIKNNNYTHIGISSIKDGYLNPVTITNTGTGFTNFRFQSLNEVTTPGVLQGTDVSTNGIPLRYNIPGISTVNAYVSIGTIFQDKRIIKYEETATTRTIYVDEVLAGDLPSGIEVDIKKFDPVDLFFDYPLSYDNLFLEYASGSSGQGQYAIGNLQVGLANNVLDFELNNNGYSYGQGEILTVPTGGVTGIPTISKFEVTDVYNTGIVTGLYALQNNDNFGYSIAVSSDGSTVAIGAPNDGLPNGTDTGVVYVYDISDFDITPSNVTYDPATGLSVFTVVDHGLSIGQRIRIKTKSITFTCDMDNNKTEGKYPDSDQYASGRALPIISTTKDTFTVFVGESGPNQSFTPSNANYNPATGKLVLTITSHGLSAGEGIVIKNNSLSFTCDMDNNQSVKTYPRPCIDPFAERSILIEETTTNTITINAGISSANRFFTPSAADYDSVTGILTVTVGQHGIGTARNIVFKNESLSFRCDQDGFASSTFYPRSGIDPFSDKKSVEVINVGFTSHTATLAQYDAVSGIVTLTVPTHGFDNGDYILIEDESLSFTCDLDDNTIVKAYPRPCYDYPSNRWLSIGNVSTNTFEINIGSSSDSSRHTFISASTNGIRRQDGTMTLNVGAAGTASGSVHVFEWAIPNAIEFLPQSNHTFVGASVDAVQIKPQSAHTFVRSDSGSVTVFDNLSRIGILTGSTTNNTGDKFGSSVAIGGTGSPVVVGGPGALDVNTGQNTGLVYVFEYQKVLGINTYVESQIINPVDRDGLDYGSTGDEFGISISLSDDGEILAVGAPSMRNPDLGGRPAAEGVVFTYNYSQITGQFEQEDVFSGPETKLGDRFGQTIKISRDSNYLLVRAPNDEIPDTPSTGEGVVTLYKKLDISIPEVDLKPSRWEVTQQFNKKNLGSNATIGDALAISSDNRVIAIGAKNADSSEATSNGRVLLYDKLLGIGVTEVWEYTESIFGSLATSANDNFGSSIAINSNGDTIVVGAPNDENPSLGGQSGLVYVFDRKTRNRISGVNDWVQVGVLTALYANDSGDNYGYDVSGDENLTFFAGSALKDDTDLGNPGIGTHGVVYFTEIKTENKFTPLLITIDKTFTDSFSGWTFGSLQVLDSFDGAFNGSRVEFQLKLGGEEISIESRPGSNLLLDYNLIVLLNDIYQVPKQSYSFTGGSFITFTEAPQKGDKCVIIFYRGTDGVDTKFKNILETIKPGDVVTINDSDLNFQQEDRTVSDIVTTDIIETNTYSGPGIDPSEERLRAITWCKQLTDKVVGGIEVNKARRPYEPEIYPKTKLLVPLGIEDDEIWVQNVKTFFDSENEYPNIGLQKLPQRDVLIIDNPSTPKSQASATVSIAGSSVSAITLTDGGSGYISVPDVTISYPTVIGFNTLSERTDVRAEAVALLNNSGIVTGFDITNSGAGYDSTVGATAFISPPTVNKETIFEVLYQGDFGLITGISTAETSISDCNLVLDLFIPLDSYLRDSEIVESPPPNPISGLTTGYYFSIEESNIGAAISSLNPLVTLDNDGNPLFYGDSFIDGIYQVSDVLTFNSATPGIAVTATYGITFAELKRIVVPVQNYNGIDTEITGLAQTSGLFVGKYSWGRLIEPKRGIGTDFATYNIGLSGIATSPDVIRVNELKSLGYTA